MTQNDQREVCCPRFNPEPWDKREVTWTDKLFVKDRVKSVFHIPLNFGAVMTRNMALIEGAGAAPEEMIVLSDENSLWGADVFIAAQNDVPGAQMTRLSGTFHCRVFDGPYSQARKWIGEMTAYLKELGKAPAKLYIFYTTCPKCAKLHGHNYVVIMAKV